MTDDDGLDTIRSRFTRNYPPAIDTGKGWHNILLEMDTALAAADPVVAYIQIKEKWGELRVYTTSTTNEEARAIIRRAEEKSRVTCEQCGGNGSMHTRGSWYRTLCGSCAAETNYVPYQRR
ncbi:MAG: hypothetical protein KDB26_15630 [Microthrixaceae bacterium]|nr:hypothetical protein [Microthrixaceae bacterium]